MLAQAAPASFVPAVGQALSQNFWTFHSTCFSHPETWPHMGSKALKSRGKEMYLLRLRYLQTTFCRLTAEAQWADKRQGKH